MAQSALEMLERRMNILENKIAPPNTNPQLLHSNPVPICYQVANLNDRIREFCSQRATLKEFDQTCIY